MKRAVCCIAALVALAILGGCPRSYPEGQNPAEYAKVTHPWEQPGWQPPQPVTGPDVPAASTQEQVQTPEKRGPVLSQEDTLVEQQLTGRWLQVCTAVNETLQLAPPGQRFVLQLEPNGTASYHLDREGKTQVVEGEWHKTQPGVISFRMGQDTAETAMYSQLYSGQFLYMWNYDHQQGLWYVRLPEQAAARISANRFSTTRGELKLATVMQNQFSGTLTDSGAVTDVTGYYESGVLGLSWVDKARNSSGFAMFIVSPDWQTLSGVWWLNDYEAAPFGGDWQGTAL